jgi:hypothetical protein
MRQTELISGIAAGVRYTVHVSGDKDGVSTSHHTIFKVGDITVLFTSAAPALISDGDRLVLAGQRKGARMLLAGGYQIDCVNGITECKLQLAERNHDADYTRTLRRTAQRL